MYTFISASECLRHMFKKGRKQKKKAAGYKDHKELSNSSTLFDTVRNTSEFQKLYVNEHNWLIAS